MARNRNIIVDLGTTFVSIYEGGSVIVRQPNVGLFDTARGKLSLLSYGYDLNQDTFSVPEGCELISPVVDGVLINGEAQSLILKQLFRDLKARSVLDATRVYVTISSGLTAIEKDETEKVFSKIGYRDIIMVESVLSLLDYADYQPTLVAILGGGGLETGVISGDGIVSACALNIGGNAVNRQLSDKIYQLYNVKVSNMTAEKLKLQIGSLFENDLSRVEISGRDLIDGRIKNLELTAEAVREAILFCYDKMAEAIASILTTIPQRMLDAVKERGLVMAGGGALMHGAEDYFAEKLNMPVRIIAEPQLAVVRGLGKVLEGGRFEF